jgi:tetratricopeptide (TPR) repeat protein
MSTIRLACALVVCALSVMAHGTAVKGNFLLFDDPDVVTENEHVLAGLTLESVRWAFTTQHFSNWMPVTWLSLMLDTQCYGTSPVGYHFTNLVIHSFSAVILLLVLFQLSQNTAGCVFVAAIFAVHPVNVQAVAWVAERKGLLSSMFWILGLLAYTFYRKKPSLLRYAAIMACLVLSLMSKQMAVTFAISLLLIDFWQLRGIVDTDTERSAFPSKLIVEKVPFFLVGVAFVVVGYLAQQSGGAIGDTTRYPVGIRLMYAIVGYTDYLAMSLFPLRLQFHYHNYGNGPGMVRTVLSAIVLVTLMVGTFRARDEAPAVFVGFWWFLITLLPVIGILQIGQQRLADRYAYVPLIGIYVCYAAILFASPLRGIVDHKIRIGIGALLTLFLAVIARAEVRYWQNDVTLYQRALELDPTNPKALVNLATVKSQGGEIDEAKELYSRALAVDANDYHAHHNLGRLYSKLNDSESAIRHYKLAIAGAGVFPMASNNLAIEYLNAKDFASAKPLFEENLRRSPNSSLARGNLGTFYFRQQQFEQAEHHYRQALEASPRSVNWRFQRARSLAMMEMWSKAEEEYIAALALAPEVGDSYRGLARVYGHQSRLDEAMNSLRAAIQVEGRKRDTLAIMAFLLVTSTEELSSGEPLLTSLIESATKDESGWARLIRALIAANRGEFDKAIHLASEAIDISDQEGDVELGYESRRAISSFESRTPYRLANR